MDEGFSGTVRISNITRDFIDTSANCIIPLETRIVEEPLVAVRKRDPVKNGAKKGAVKISLNDCLACSGCITSAETVLVEEQSITRSPQAVTGALVKDYLSRRLEVPGRFIYPRLLEVDSLLDDVSNITESEADGWLGDFSRGVLYGNPGGTSGGFAEMLVRRFAAEHGGEVREERLAKNLDVLTVHRNGDVVLRAAKVYGFRNIQNLVRKMKNGKSHYDYVEVQACPNGCGNGGAQIRADTTEERENILSKRRRIIRNDTSEIAGEWSRLNPELEEVVIH
ncbi:hypothetical protein OSTOST_10655 [Ostertagia ostertagi]